MFNALKSALFYADPKDRKSEPPAQPAKVVQGSNATQPVFTNFNPGVNPDMVEALRAVIQGRKSAFTSLSEQAAKLEGIIPDAGMRMKAAFATVNRPVKDIVQAIEIHISDLNGEVMKFKSHSANEKTTQVGLMRAQSKSLVDSTTTITTQIAEYEAKANQLREQLTANASKASELNLQADSVESKLQAAEVSFEASAKSIISELELQKQSFLSTVGENK